ncbi:glycosyltransferase [Actinoplanes subglobosus]|uniref:Glycosyltransferase n=1 Tax=Actinoplanes subglobosus TaxID=1547892 RepID=A0ABV8IWJ7_9ACTN
MADVTIVIPTFNEAGNVPELLARLDTCFPPGTAEVLFVDDSTDHTPQVIEEEATRHRIPVRLLHRAGAARVGGLSGAVIDGIRHAHTARVLVMDGDLQHPPEVAVRLLRTMDDTAADVVVASRYVDGGDAGGLGSTLRHAVSQGSTLLARALFPRLVGSVCTDPMTGFFCVRKEALELVRLRPRGFKILLEILASHRVRVAEVPFTFGDRTHGASKADWRNGRAFLAQLLSLRLGPRRPSQRSGMLPQPPADAEVDAYLKRPQHRWIFWAQALAFAGVAVSMWGLSNNSYWTLAFLAPLVALLLEQALALRTSTFRRTVTTASHQALLDGYRPDHHPSVDVFLPTAGEPAAMLENTYRHVARLRWPGILTVFVLDDAGRAEVAALAAKYGFRYVSRRGSEFKKAGNLQYALERSVGEHVTIFDADFTPRPDYLLQLMPYMDDPVVGIVQSPQYFETAPSMSWLERCAGATQEMFYRFIQPSRDAVGAAICVGTSAVYRREALAAIGGFPLIGHSEDVYTGVRMGRVGYRVKYVPVLVSRGKSPDDVDSFINQQYRWCEGSMSLLVESEFHDDTTLTLDRRLSFWSGFVYYLTTAMNALLAPLAVLVMLWFFPDRVTSSNMLPLLGALLVWLALYPAISYGRWRFDVLRVQTIYGFAHLFCVLDLARGKVAEWVATNATRRSAAKPTSRRPLAWRVRLAIAVYLTVTQVAILTGLLHGAWTAGLADYWANLLLALVNAYIFIPVATLCVSALLRDRRAARAARAEPAVPVNAIRATPVEVQA